MSKLIVYESPTERLICTPKDEETLIEKYFVQGGRLLEDFDRYEVKGVIAVTAHTTMSGQMVQKDR